MPPRQRPQKPPSQALLQANLAEAAVQIFAANERMNQMILENLDPAAWRAKPPGQARSLAAIFTHLHNVRTKWIRLSAQHLKVPAQLHRARCTRSQARTALAVSAARCQDMLAEALSQNPGGRIKKFRRDSWFKPWPPGPAMLCYMLVHEAHHRGQVFLLARQLGFPLPKEITYGIWNWDQLWKQPGGHV